MKKLIASIGVLAAAGLTLLLWPGGGVVLTDNSLRWGEYRIAVADRPCPIEPEFVSCYVQSLADIETECLKKNPTKPEKCPNALSSHYEDCDQSQTVEYNGGVYPVCDEGCNSPMLQKFKYLQRKCVYHKTVKNGNWCICATHDQDPLNGEVSLDSIPDQYFRRLAVCETDDGEKRVIWAEMDQQVPSGWNCVLILNRVLWRNSMRGTRSRVLVALQEKCCADCLENCWVSEGAWGQCPYCLLDNSCGNYCQQGGAP